MIYLDNSATTRPYAEVLDTFRKVSELFFANPSSIHGLGGRSENLLKETRAQAARLLNVEESELVFTSGGTEGNNLAIKGVAFQYMSRGKHLITSNSEHPATLNAFSQLEALGFDVTYLPVDEMGQINLDELLQAIRPDTILVSLIHVNNEWGSIQPVEAIGNLLSEYPKIVFHVDHVQGLTKVPLDFKRARLDLCTMSGHKIHGPKGTGLLYVRNGLRISPLFSGGGQEQDRRSGTENLPGMAGMVKALRLTLEKEKAGRPHLTKLNRRLRESLGSHPDIILNSPNDAAPHILNISVLGLKPEVLIHSLEEEEIFISTKSACSSRRNAASHVLLNAGIPEEIAKQAVRISLSFENTAEEIDTFLTVFHQKVAKLRQVME
ncbi:MAG TPA: cysteine desulfurase family protein [Candidatus Angelobacter sp.]|nr:cysteine desulfurase family protein [Candidatus Angelobacter sp.]